MKRFVSNKIKMFVWCNAVCRFVSLEELSQMVEVTLVCNIDLLVRWVLHQFDFHWTSNYTHTYRSRVPFICTVHPYRSHVPFTCSSYFNIKYQTIRNSTDICVPSL